MKSGKLRVLICDDHALIREGFKRVLLDTGEADHIGEAAGADEAIAAVRKEPWDIVILDISLAGRSGLEVLQCIKAEFPRLPVLILSMYPEEQFAVRAFRAGANGYLNKNLTAKKLIDAVRQVLASGRYISPEAGAQLLNAVRQPEGQPTHSRLSDREYQVLCLIGAGRAVGEIATQLALSVKTVSTYRGLVLQKLGLDNNAQLMRYVQQHGLLE